MEIRPNNNILDIALQAINELILTGKIPNNLPDSLINNESFKHIADGLPALDKFASSAPKNDIKHEIAARQMIYSALQQNERKYRSLWEAANEGFCLSEIIKDEQGNAVDYCILDVNAAYKRMTGLATENDVGTLGSTIYGVTPPPYMDIYARVVSTGVFERFEAKFYASDRFLDISVFSPSPGQFATVLFDISERKIHEDELGYQARHDSLTQLPNRLMFNETLAMLLSARRKADKTLAVLFIDLDRFKFVNDTLGHDAGDELLVETAQRLKECLRDNDILCRMGGDEFTAILKGCCDNESITVVTNRILTKLKAPFTVAGHEVNIGASIGVAFSPTDATTVSDLLKKADTAMYHAKELGRNNCQLYSSGLDAGNLDRMRLEQDLRIATEARDIEIHYQPLLDPLCGELLGLEAILRWTHKTRGEISDGEFIPIAEDSDLIMQIGNYMLETVCAQQSAWKNQGLDVVPVAINLSRKHVRRTEFLERIEHVLNEYNLDPGLLVLEVPGDALFEAGESELAAIKRLRILGVEVILDGFGTKPMPLIGLSRVPIDILKIDCSLLTDALSDITIASVAASISATAHNMGLQVIAVGVETDEQMRLMGSLMCDAVQGLKFCAPLKPQSITDIIAHGGIDTSKFGRAA
ncbi:MAG: EAL domain-containing protein [Armatimonadetes bacterium]|nr:EAL domain-containing protein [Armatimonadota bacterium]